MGLLSRATFFTLAILTLSSPLHAKEIKCTGDTQITGDQPPDGTAKGCVKHDAQGNQVRHGSWVEWYINGQKHSEGEYVDGKRTGIWVWWHTNGQKMQEGKYWDGIPSGTWAAWDEDGNKLENNPKAKAGNGGGTNNKSDPSSASPTLDDFSKNLRHDFGK